MLVALRKLFSNCLSSENCLASLTVWKVLQICLSIINVVIRPLSSNQENLSLIIDNIEIAESLKCFAEMSIEDNQILSAEIGMLTEYEAAFFCEVHRPVPRTGQAYVQQSCTFVRLSDQLGAEIATFRMRFV